MLLLLAGYSATAKANHVSNEFQHQHKTTFSNSADSFHKNMLQPQMANVNVTSEHPVKQVNFGDGIIFCDRKFGFLQQPSGQLCFILQDVNRCENVSRLLFPHHFFW
jgi:hypothetical protein